VTRRIGTLLVPVPGLSGTVYPAGTTADELITIINSRHSQYGYDQRIEVFGSAGMLTADNVRPTTVRRYSNDGTGQGDPNLTLSLERYDASYRIELEAFVQAIQSGASCSPGYLDGMRALELAYAAAESARSGSSIRVKQRLDTQPQAACR
jgi:myo-inositol 2-dehydrogenase / D-chiro-inositol 1-dehydrogenase